MSKSSIETRLDWGHLGLLAIFSLATLVFLYDTLSESFRLENVIVILPISLLVILLCAVQTVSYFRRSRSESSIVNDQNLAGQMVAVESGKQVLKQSRVPVFMALLGLYVLGLIYVAFDLSTFLFLFFALWLQGEKRLVFGAIYSAVLALALTWGLRYMVPFPFPTVFF